MRSETFHTAPFFAHRRNRDGSFTSICLECLATVASHRPDEELKEQDKKHVCEKIHSLPTPQSRIVESQ
jgi:hypothetical protein